MRRIRRAGVHLDRRRPRRSSTLHPVSRDIGEEAVTTSALPALSDIPEDVVPGVLRIENSDKDATTPIIMDMLRSVYPHDQIFGEYCPVQAYIAAPPDEVWEYLADTRSLEEWTY